MSATDVRTPYQVAGEIGRTVRYHPEKDVTELRRELGTAHLAKKAREIIARFPRPTEDQIQAVAEILRGSAE